MAVEGLWFALVIGAFAAVLGIYRTRKARQIISRWAAANDLTVVARHLMLFRLSPWPFAMVGKQAVRYVTVRGPEGLERRCWLLVGDLWWGLIADKVEVVWENGQPQHR